MLAQHQLYTENMGGDIQAVPISALNGTNIDTLVDAILLQSEIMELKCDPTGLAEGVIVESKQDIHKGCDIFLAFEHILLETELLFSICVESSIVTLNLLNV